MDNFAKTHNFKTPEDWAACTRRFFCDNGGRGIISEYKTFWDMLKTVYPNENWEIKKCRKQVSRNHWQTEQNKIEFMNDFAIKNDIKSPSDWAKVSVKKFSQAGGNSLLQYYPNFKALVEDVYPDIDWTTVKFPPQKVRLTNFYWDNEENIKIFMDTVAKALNITSMNDWYRVSIDQIKKLGGSTLIMRYKNLKNILDFVYPGQNWNQFLLGSRSKKSSQRILFITLKKLFPNEEVIEEFLFETGSDSVEFDIFIPSLRLAFEFQGAHHYHDTPCFGPAEMYMARDDVKKEFCKSNEINLVIVPYWWEITEEKVMDAINSTAGIFRDK